MSTDIFNKREKLAAPPFVTVLVEDMERRRDIFKTCSKFQDCEIDEKSATFSYEGELLKAFIIRKGTQLRLEKALMLAQRILTLVTRWKSNGCWDDFCKFKDAFTSDELTAIPKKRNKVGKQESGANKASPQPKMEHVKGNKGNMKEIRLPSRQWSNWVIYLTLRDLLLLSKIKYECERSVGYWLGLISCSHHPADSLIIVGILSRLWVVSSGIVEDYANQIYPRLCTLASLLNPTKADNWLQDIDFPNDVFTWLEKILGFPFKSVSIGSSSGYERLLCKDESRGIGAGKLGKMLEGVFGTSQEGEKSLHSDIPSTSSGIRDKSSKYAKDEEEEDLGIPVNIPPRDSEKKNKQDKKKKLTQKVGKKIVLNERWTKFFKKFKAKLETENGRKQLLTRIKKYKKNELDAQIILKLQKLLKFVKNDKRDTALLFIPKFKRFLSKKITND